MCGFFYGATMTDQKKQFPEITKALGVQDTALGLYYQDGVPKTAPIVAACAGFKAVADLTADVGLSYSNVATGDVVIAGYNRYEVVASGTASPDVTTAGGVKLNLTISDIVHVACSDELTVITTGTAKVTFRMPRPMTVKEVRASLTTTSSSGVVTVDINEGGTSILSTKLTIDAGETTSTTAATPAVISDSALADDAEMTVDIDTAGTEATGLKIALIGAYT